MTDWNEIRKYKLSDIRPDDWPDGVRAISMKGLGLFGIHQHSGRLFFDGKEVLTRNKVRLGTFERWIASFAALGTFGNFIVGVGRAAGWWY